MIFNFLNRFELPNLYDKIRLEKGEEMIDGEEILSKMNPNQKINYDRVMQKMVQGLEKNEERPTILMHVCCAPSTYTLEYLNKVCRCIHLFCQFQYPS